MDTFSFTIRRTDSFQEFTGVEALTIPTPSGSIQILPGHADLIAETAPGECAVECGGKEEIVKLNDAGLVKIKEGMATLIL